MARLTVICKLPFPSTLLDCKVYGLTSSSFLARYGWLEFLVTSEKPEDATYSIPYDEEKEFLTNLDITYLTLCVEKILAKVCKLHDKDHCVKVMEHARLAMIEDGKVRKSVLYAALLHDVDDGKFFPTHKNYENLREVLRGYKNVEKVVRMVSLVSSSENGDHIPTDCIEHPWMLYPRYADRLEAIGKIGVLRCWQYSKTKRCLCI